MIMRKFLIVHGFVQGVGYRYFVKQLAKKHKINGFVRNAGDGSVEVLADGDEPSIFEFVKELKVDVKGGAQVFSIEEDSERAKAETERSNGFQIIK